MLLNSGIQTDKFSLILMTFGRNSLNLRVSLKAKIKKKLDFYILVCSSAKYEPILDFKVSAGIWDSKDFKFDLKYITLHTQTVPKSPRKSSQKSFVILFVGR